MTDHLVEATRPFIAPEWRALAERDPGETAIAHSDGLVSVGELESAARRLAATLLEAGVQPGDRVVVALPTSPRFVATYLAIRHCGAVFVNAPWQWRRELVAVADETGARTVLLASQAAGDAALRPLHSRALVDTPASGRTVVGKPVVRDRDAPAWIAYSSGTTGAPKGAVHSELTLGVIPDGFIGRYGIGPRDAVLVAAPVGHAVGFIYGVQLALRARCPMVLLRRWDAAEAMALTQRHRCTFTAAPTPLLLDAVELGERAGPEAFATLRFFLSGGSSVPGSLLTRARKALPSTETSSYYGTSECGGVTSWPPGTDAAAILAGEGLPLPGMEVACAGGELMVRGVQMATGYVGRDIAGRFRDDGWYSTGDRATIDVNGSLRLVGRVHDVIRRGGVDVAPAEVEEVLGEHPHVRDVAVFGVADQRLGARVAAVIVPVAGAPSLEELRAHCDRHGLAKVKWPERAAFLDRLPRSPTGKLDRGSLIELFGSGP
ncbi:MAG: class I adenylate-forming enzyme family protein [Solirubrobacteraceae bacterium]